MRKYEKGIYTRHSLPTLAIFPAEKWLSSSTKLQKNMMAAEFSQVVWSGLKILGHTGGGRCS